MVFIREFPVPSEGVRITKENVEAQVGQKRLGKGVLYVAENAISWIYSQSSDEGFRILYPDMVLHAVSRDRDLCPADCIYVMLNQRMSSSPEAGDNEPEPGEDPEDEMTEVRFMPEDPACLQELYTIISECNLLHDPPPSNSSDEADNDNEDGYNPGLAEEDMDQEDDDEDRLAMFNRMNIHFGNGGGAGDGADGTHHPEQYDPDQFEDAD